MLTRRQVLNRLSHLSATSALLAVSTPSVAMVDTPLEQPRFVLFMLRGGLDGLAAVPPYADPDYARLRPRLVASSHAEQPGIVKLDDQFGLHPAMAPLKAWYDAGEMLIVHATGMPYQPRSHVAAQQIFERGTLPDDTRDGWLNRALHGLPRGASLGLAVGRVVPLILRGQGSIRTFAPPYLPKLEEDVLQRLNALYTTDSLFHQAFEQARPFINDEQDVRWRWDPNARRPTLRFLAEETGKLLMQPHGPRVAVLESHGWDTHAQQAARLPEHLAQLVDGLIGLKRHLAPVWPQTLVLAVAEFGRTALENLAAGTDHGAGGAALVFGGAIDGGRVAGSWPGLGPRDLLQGRHLRPTTDLRSLLKAILRDHLGLAEPFIEDQVFPNSRSAPPFTGLKRLS